MSTAVSVWQEKNPALAQRGLDESTWNALKSTIYPGAKDDSIILAVDYCRARQLDPMLKPVHLVPMNVKVQQPNGKPKYEWRDVPMPGIGLYRIQAARSGDFGGMDEPEYGPDVTTTFSIESEDDRGFKSTKQVNVTYPLWCKITVYKIVQGVRCPFTAKEFWTENYATAGKGSEAPNAMWAKRPFGQLGKCTEAQVLRKAWPEACIGHTAEEMAGKSIDLDDLRDITPQAEPTEQARPAARQAAEPNNEAVEGELIKGDTAPERKQAAPAKQASQEPAGETIKPNHIRMIRAKLEARKAPDTVLLAAMQVDCLESIPLARINDAMDFLKTIGQAN